MGKINRYLSKAFIFPIKGYQYLISPLFGNCCRFYPTCSAYTISAVETHGIFYGFFLSVKRILRCHPWHQGGVDPVPEIKKC